MAKQNFYRCGQVAKELGLSSYKIRRLAESGLIPDAEFSGAQWHIPVAAVERMKKEGVPPLPKVVDTDAEGTSSPTANQKERAPTTLLAEPSPEMIAAAEEAEMSGRQLTVAKNQLERNRVRRDEAEIQDFFADRAKRLQEQEAAEQRRFEEELEADARKREDKAAAERRKKFYSDWLEYALRQKPYGAPTEVELDIHEQVLAALAKVDSNEREFIVRRLVDGAVERALKPWKTGETKRAAIEDALSQLPYRMNWDQSWKEKATKTASEELADIPPGVSKEEMGSLARAALQPLVAEFEHAGKIEEAVSSVRIDGATDDELCESQELVREALSDLPNGASNRHITEAKEKALAPISARVAERIASKEAQRRREQVLSSVSWNLPREISDEDEKAAIAEINEALNDLPANAPQQDMEKARDQVTDEYQQEYRQRARRAEKKAEQARNRADLIQYGLAQIHPYAERMLRKFDYNHGETAWSIDSRVRSEVRNTLEEELGGRESEQEVAKIVRQAMREIEGCD